MPSAVMNVTHGVLGMVVAIVRQPAVFIRVLQELGTLISRNRLLLIEMTRRQICDPFAGSSLGYVWSFVHPLVQMGIYTIVFAFVFRPEVVHMDGDPLMMNFTVHMIAGYLPWMVFSSVMNQAPTAVLGEGNLVKQVVFPLEILPLKKLLAVLLPQAVGTIFLIGYTLIRYHTLPWTWVFWPLFVVCELMLVAGIAFFVSAIGVYFRDMKDIASICTSMLFYLTPILYSVEMAPGWLKWVLTLNPVTFLVQPFRDICFHGQVAHPVSWILLPVISVISLVCGYRVFRKLKPYFGNAL